MKKTIPFVVAGLLCGLAACGNGGNATDGDSDSGGENVASYTWTEESQLPDDGGSASSVVGCNITRSSDGVVTVFYTIKLQSFGIYFSRSSDGGKTWEGPTPFTPAGPGAYGPNVAIDPDDRMHVVWRGHAPDGVYHSSSDDGGAAWTDAVLLKSDVSGNIISVDRKGRVHVTFHEGEPDSADKISEVHYIRSADRGETWENPRLLSKDDGKHSAWARFDFSGTSSDSLGMVWRDKRAGYTWDLYGAFSEDGGATWTEKPVRVSTEKQWDPMCLVDADGRLHVTMMEYPAGNQFEVGIGYQYTSDGGETWSTFQKMSDVRSRFPFLMYNPEHDLVWLCWKDERDFDFQTGNANADIVGLYSLDGGDSWSDLEWVAEHGTEDLRFHTFHLGTDGILRTVYSYIGSNDNLERVWYTERSELQD